MEYVHMLSHSYLELITDGCFGRCFFSFLQMAIYNHWWSGWLVIRWFLNPMKTLVVGAMKQSHWSWWIYHSWNMSICSIMAMLNFWWVLWIMVFPFDHVCVYWEFHHPNWRTLIFFRGGWLYQLIGLKLELQENPIFYWKIFCFLSICP